MKKTFFKENLQYDLRFSYEVLFRHNHIEAFRKMCWKHLVCIYAMLGVRGLVTTSLTSENQALCLDRGREGHFKLYFVVILL